MISLQSSKGRKIIVAGLALLAFFGTIYVIHSLNRASQAFDEALNLKQHNLAKYRQKVLEKKVIKSKLLGLQNTFKRAESALLTGKTPSLAAAEIQEIVTGITKTAGVQIKTVRILKPDRSGKEMYLTIPVEVTINSTMRELTQLLYKLEKSNKLLRIAKLRIRSHGRAGRRGRRASSKNIATTLTIEGFVKKIGTKI